MVEFFHSFVLFGSFIWFWIIFGLLIITLFASDIQEQGYGASFSLTLFLGLNYFWGNLNILSFLNYKHILMYLCLGLLYSFIRTYFYAKKEGEIGRRYLKENIFRWWFLWPISLINWIFSDLISNLYDLIYSKLNILFNKIFDWGLPNKNK